MELSPDRIAAFPLPLFQRYGARCCRRIQQHIADPRFAKILRKLEQCSGASPQERMRRDAYNAANAAYHELRVAAPGAAISAAVMCTLVCACDESANANLLGNFRTVLQQAEGLSLDAILEVEAELLRDRIAP